MSAFAERMSVLAERLHVHQIADRSAVDTRIDGLIGDTRLSFLPVGNGGIALAMLTDNPACTHYDEVFPHLIRELEGRGSGRHHAKPKLHPNNAKTIFEASSGNAGPSIAWIARAYGYQPLVVIPQGMQSALPGRFDAHRVTLGDPIQLLSVGEKADAVVDLARQGGSGLVESWYGSYRNKDQMTGMVQTVAEIYKAWDAKGRPEEMFFLNHSRRPEAPEAFADTGKRLIEQTKREWNADVDTFVGAIGNGTTIEGIALALRAKLQGVARVVAFEPAKDPAIAAERDLVGTANLDGIAMPNVKRETYDLIIEAKPHLWEEPANGVSDSFLSYNHGKKLIDTVGRTTIAALEIAKREIMEGRSRIVLVLAYDRRDRYEAIIDNPEATYGGKGTWL